MSADTPIDVQMERVSEKLRQERESFNQAKRHDNQWFYIKIGIILVSFSIMVIVLYITSIIVFNPKLYSENTVILGTIGLYRDTIASCSSIWRLGMSPDSVSKLKPITKP